MNTSNIKKVAPQARREFINAVTKRLNELGIHSDNQIAECTQQGELLNIEGRHFDAAIKPLRDRLVTKVKTLGFEPLVENVAYTWFNRMCAIRYMELHGYLDHGLRVLSHPSNPNTFEILEHAQDIAEELGLNRERIVEFKLAGNKDEILYRELLIGQCHQLHKAMPFLFEALDDETELLLPDNLTRTDSILRILVNDIPEEDWQQVEIIGWLYQFYISEKKDEVIGNVVKSEDIPAATQLFTPNWIVKYLVQNSVGRQWLQTYPDSSLKSLMEYYIEPAEQSDEVNAQLEAITPDNIEPESIKVLDPACGSGHILVEAYQLLKAIYEERGYRSRDIPKLILENNLFGLDIDDRAAQLSGFALMMLARADDRRVFTRDISLNVLSIQESGTIDLDLIWRDLGIDDPEIYNMVQDIWSQFEQGKTLGSLVDIPSDYEQSLINLLNKLDEIEAGGEFLQRPAASSLKPIIHQAWILAQRYDVVVANPPYMGSGNFNSALKAGLKGRYKITRTDLYAVFIERMLDLCNSNSFLSMITMQSWMFTASYQELREKIVNKKTIESLVQLGSKAFESIAGEIVSTAMFVFRNSSISNSIGTYVRLTELSAKEKQTHFYDDSNRFTFPQDNFPRVSSCPLVYWKEDLLVRLFEQNDEIGSKCNFREGIHTANNDKFVRSWWEVNHLAFSTKIRDYDDFEIFDVKWVPYNKGGGCFRWFGNYEFVIAFDKKSRSEMEQLKGHVRPSKKLYFNKGGTWSDVGTKGFGVKYYPDGFLFDGKGPVCVGNDIKVIISALNSKPFTYLAELLMPTVSYKCGTVKSIPIAIPLNINEIRKGSDQLIELTRNDYNERELSWEFRRNALVTLYSKSLENAINLKLDLNKRITEKVIDLEEYNNQSWIDAYGLGGEQDAKPEQNTVNLFANLEWRYPNKKNNILTAKDRSNLFINEQMCELISYSIGCMMGRYSLDREGLVYAHSCNEGFTDLVSEDSYKTFPADDDGIIPLTDQDWFVDDATNRFREFVRVVWGEDHLQENLDFVSGSLCLYAIKPKQGESSLETIRRYLSNQFYKDHLKSYKKRPIYWLFSSGKQKAFECLVYLHRYNKGTLARMRTEYVTPLLGKYDAYNVQLQKQMDDASSTVEANRLKKEQTALQKKQNELREFDDKLKHYADRRISLDLDDGVKVNYGKFGDLLAEVKSVTGKKPEVN